MIYLSPETEQLSSLCLICFFFLLSRAFEAMQICFLFVVVGAFWYNVIAVLLNYSFFINVATSRLESSEYKWCVDCVAFFLFFFRPVQNAHSTNCKNAFLVLKFCFTLSKTWGISSFLLHISMFCLLFSFFF